MSWEQIQGQRGTGNTSNAEKVVKTADTTAQIPLDADQAWATTAATTLTLPKNAVPGHRVAVGFNAGSGAGHIHGGGGAGFFAIAGGNRNVPDGSCTTFLLAPGATPLWVPVCCAVSGG